MFKYLLGLLKNIFNPGVSILSYIDNYSMVDRKAKTYRKAKIYHSSVDAFSYVGVGTSLVYAKVGKFCSIAGNSLIGMGIHTLNNVSTSPIFTEAINATGHSWVEDSLLIPFKPVIVGNDVWIGSRVMVMGGVNIGNGAVIGAGAIVTKDVPPYAVVAGVPAKIIRYRFDEETIRTLESVQWWNMPEDKLKKHIDLFQSEKVSKDKINDLKC